ncbi:MAG: asparagine synthase (glutamine-hydrolyzing) [Myxococcota bacterium]|jgi:asparagine synthase (glutamine-hydrolysing)
MCGVVAVLGHRVPNLDPALDALHHRGPDGRGQWRGANGNIALGHTRLALVDPAGGAQPLFNEDRSVVAVVNGEFYGHRAIRDSLTSRGHRFRTRSDSEILVHLYEQYGLDCVEHLRGEFAFVLWDAPRRRLFAARDRFGVKPLCFARPQSRQPLMLASEAKALLALGHPARWDRRSLWHAAHHQYLPRGRSLFENVEQLPSGHRLVATADTLTIDEYWSLDFPTDLPPASEAVAELRDRLDTAVALRLEADVPVAFYLSGGIDSAAVVALAAKHIERPVCFNIAFDHPPYDERDAAALVADHLSAELHTVEVSQDTLVNLLPTATVMSEGLAINGQLPAKLALSRAVAEAGYKAVLVGEGADEMLCGYSHLGLDYAAWTNTSIKPGPANDGGVMRPNSDAPALDLVRRRIGSVPSFLRAKAGFGRTLAGFLRPALPSDLHGQDPFDALLTALSTDQLAGRNPVDQATWLWTHLTLTGYILRTLGDGTEMASSIEGRVPFLDHKLAEFLMALSPHDKFRGGIEKTILRDAVSDLLPQAIVNRRKQPLLAPPITRYRSPHIRSFIRDTLTQTDLYDRDDVMTWLTDVECADEVTQRSAEPILMSLLTATILERHYGLT